jgi:protein required for attachment to host cells
MKKESSTTWVVVADNCQAKIYRITKFPKIEEISYLEHPDARLHNQELISQKPGHNIQRGGVVGYSYQPEIDRKQLEASKFAVDLARIIATHQEKGDFARLYVIAEPSFLGMLRKHFSAGVRKTIVGELARELTSFDPTLIEHHIANL